MNALQHRCLLSIVLRDLKLSSSVSHLSSIFQRLVERAESAPGNLAILDRGSGESLTFGDLIDRIERCMVRLAEIDGPVALSVDNPIFCDWFFAARAIDLPVVLMDAAQSPDEKRRLCRRLGIRNLVHRLPSSVYGAEDAAGRSVSVEVLDEVAVSQPPAGTEIVKLTSGSTGAPTGACFSEQELIVGVEQIGRGMQIDDDDHVLLVIPMTHSYGFDNGALSLALLGTPLILESRIFPKEILRALVETETRVLLLVPPLVRALGQGAWPELPRLRRVICAGGVLPAEFSSDFRRASGVPVHNFYGSSETGGICFETRPDDPTATGTVGRPLPGVNVDLGPNGEVSVLSAANLLARWAEDGPQPPMDRRVETGDLGEWTTEGRLRLTGRAADRLNIGGRKVAAAEIEAALRALPEIKGAAVIGVEDQMRGDRVVAFLIAENWPVDLKAIPKRIRPRECHRLDEFPINARGKLDRATLRRLLEKRLPESPLKIGN